ncbi:MAG: hypothetical protein R2734_19720 [Nocardioides sp.]
MAALHYFRGRHLPPWPDRTAAGWLGDLIVHTPSAAAREQDRQLPFPAEHGAHLPDLHHFDLPQSPRGHRAAQALDRRAGHEPSCRQGARANC